MLTNNMKNNIVAGLVIGVLLAWGLSVGAVKTNRPELPQANIPIDAPTPSAPATTISLSVSATSTENVPKYNVVGFDTLEGQADCLAIRDTDGDGYTYLTTLNGVANFSSSCE